MKSYVMGEMLRFMSRERLAKRMGVISDISLDLIDQRLKIVLER